MMPVFSQSLIGKDGFSTNVLPILLNPDAEQPWEEVKVELGFTGDRVSA